MSTCLSDKCPPAFVLGPTGSGKSSVAIALAKRLQRGGEACEIVSADAYQIYKDIPILTAAPSAADLATIPHHLIHSIELEQSHDAAAHARMAEQCIKGIQARGARPIVVGGSGLYVKFISHGISEAPPSDLALRERLESLSTDELVAQFQALDAAGLAATPVANKRYLVRNLEIVLLTGQGLLEWRKNWLREPCGQGWVIQREVGELDARIAKRAGLMIEEGLLEEVRKLEDRKLSATAEKVLGLELVRGVLRGETSVEEMKDALALATRRYAKRQRTWLRREAWLHVIGAGQGSTAEELAARIAGEL